MTDRPSVLPKGGEELLITLQTPSATGHMGIPALIWGAPGEGKSSFLGSLARRDFPVVTLIASIHDPTDFSGLPIHENGRVRFIPPEWTSAFDDARQGILFLDELTTAPPAVQAALLRVILERKVGFHALPEGVRVIAAANPPDIMAGGWELSPPLRNRFVHINWELTGTDYVSALQDGFATPDLPAVGQQAHHDTVGYWKMLVAAFLRRTPDLVRTSPTEEEHAFASPRTWEYAIRLMASCDLLGKAPRLSRPGGPAFTRLVEGCVGRGAAVAFTAFLKSMRLPDPDDVLNGTVSVTPGQLRDDERYVLFSSLAGALSRRKEARDDRFLDATLVFLSLAARVCEDGAVDTIFVPIRQVAKGQILPHAAACAQGVGRLSELQTLTRRVFEKTPLKDLADILVDRQ